MGAERVGGRRGRRAKVACAFGGWCALEGRDIPLFGRILAVVDVFEALTCQRPYRRAMPPEQALGILEEGIGTQFDPEIAKVFLEAYGMDEITIQAEPEPLYDSFVTSVLQHPQDATQIFVSSIVDTVT